MKFSCPEMSALVDFAYASGATDAAEVKIADIVIDDALASKCAHPRCANYGRSMSCPPYVKGPGAFREMLKGFTSAIFIRLEVPTEILLSSDASTAFQLLNKVATDIERAAIKMGFSTAKTFTAGGCKVVFCREHDSCLALGEGGKCRNPLYARQSMSGYGVDVAKLATTAGWPLRWASNDDVSDSGKTSNIYGLVLVC